MTSRIFRGLPILIWVSCFLLYVVGSVWANHVHLPPIEPYEDEDTINFAYEPLSYDLSLIIDTKDTHQYSGSIIILLTINPSEEGSVEKVIKLHLGPNVSIEMVSYYDHETVETTTDGSINFESLEAHSIRISTTRYDSSREMMHIKLKNRPKRPKGILVINFASSIPFANQHDRQGIYYMLAWNTPGYVVSNFGEGLTRLVFPCFDIASFKVPLRVSVGTTSNNEIHSTAEIQFQKHATFAGAASTSTDSSIQGRYTRFMETEPIQLGSFAFAIGPFRLFKKTWDSGIRLRVIGPREAGPHFQSIIKTVDTIVVKLDHFTKVNVNNKRMNIVMLPQSYGYNPTIYPEMTIGGLADFKVNFSAKESKLNALQGVGNFADVVIRNSMHSIQKRHGNDIIESALNEGLLSVIKAQVVHSVLYDSSSNYYTNFGTFNLLLDMDTSLVSRPIIQLAQSKLPVDDALYITKSAAIIRMMLADRALMDQNKLDRIIYLYYRFGPNPLGGQIINSSSGNTYQDLSHFLLHFLPNCTIEDLHEWFVQPGIPIIYVSFISENTMTLTQKRLVLDADPDPLSNANAITNQRWSIPVTWTLSDGRDYVKDGGISWMYKNIYETTVTLPPWFRLNSPFHFVKLNENMQGYYRVSYPIPMIERMQMSISSLEMGPLDRLDMLTNVGFMWQADLIDSEFFIRFLSWYRYEEPGMVTQSLVMWFRAVSLRFIDIPVIYDYLKEFGIILFNRIYKNYNLHIINDMRLNAAQETSLIEVYKLLIMLGYERLLTDARRVQATGMFRSIKDVPRLLATAALSGQPDFMAGFNHTALVQSTTKNETERDLMIFGAAMLPEIIIQHIWKLMETVDFKVIFQLVQTLINNGRCLEFLATYLINELRSHEDSASSKNILHIMVSLLNNANEESLMNIISQEFPGSSELFNNVMTKFLWRQQLSIRDAEKVMSFFIHN